MERRDFVASVGSVVAGVGAASRTKTPPLAEGARAGWGARASGAPFTMDYAPHFGMFRNSAGDDVVAQLEYMHDQGFRSMEDNGMRGRSVTDQERISAAMSRLGMRMGVFVLNPETAWTTTFAEGTDEFRESFLADTRASIEVAKRVRATWMTVVLGTEAPRLEPEYQTARAVEILRAASALLEPHGLVMVIEALNRRDHPSLFLKRIPQAYQICRAVDSPSCKILFDIYHQQITEGNLIPNFDAAWSEVAYVQVGDNPGRLEPGTGEINFAKVFEHLHTKGYTGIIGMEHGNSQKGVDGERAVIEAYRRADPS
ncbi:MAG: TIM barrel protein [Gemmatimonadota bacterium]